MACFDALEHCFQVNVPATEGLAPDAHAVFTQVAETKNELGVKGSRRRRRQWGWVWGIPLPIQL